MMHPSQALAPPRGTTWIYDLSDIGCRTIARALFDLRAEGLENVPPSGAAILAPNHVSNLDPVMIGISVSRRVHFMGKKELFGNPLFGWYLRVLHTYPVARDRVDPSTLKHTLALLAAGEALVMFPEGTRGDGRTLRPAKPGIGVLAARTGVPVVPAFHWGTDRILPRGSRWVRLAPVRVRFGRPLLCPREARSDPAAAQAFGQRLMDAIAALRPTPDQLTSR